MSCYESWLGNFSKRVRNYIVKVNLVVLNKKTISFYVYILPESNWTCVTCGPKVVIKYVCSRLHCIKGQCVPNIHQLQQQRKCLFSLAFTRLIETCLCVPPSWWPLLRKAETLLKKLSQNKPCLDRLSPSFLRPTCWLYTHPLGFTQFVDMFRVST